jgi:uncharacterized protein YndB with AHSA1/START domain
MTERSVTHATFTIHRVYPATSARVFAAFASPEAKTQWFAGPREWGRSAYELDFRVGGREISRVGPPGGTVHAYDARYLDIVPGERIIFAYDMHLDELKISVSLTTVEFRAEGSGTKLTFTEQGAFLDGHDNPRQREEGTNFLLDALGRTFMD